jgi:hypothetical protein
MDTSHPHRPHAASAPRDNFDISAFFHYYELLSCIHRVSRYGDGPRTLTPASDMLGELLVTLGRHLQETGKEEES